MIENTRFDADVVVVGAGPVGLSLASMLGLHGIKTILLERGDELIDYPRAVGMDDECLRTLQGIGMAEAVLPHLTPYHWMRFVTKSGRCFASIEPRTDEIGWSRRNAFNQPLVDRVLLELAALDAGMPRQVGMQIARERDEVRAFARQREGERGAQSARAPGEDRHRVRHGLRLPASGWPG